MPADASACRAASDAEAPAVAVVADEIIAEPAPPRLARLGLWQWPLLLASTVLVDRLFTLWEIPSPHFMGPLAAGLMLAFAGSDLKVSRHVTMGSQGVIGCTVARALDISLITFLGHNWPAILAVVVLTGGASCLVASALTRFTPLSSHTAAWGSMPGAANAMVALAAEDGGDIRLVAFMQYVRLIVVLSTASMAAKLLLGLHVGAAQALRATHVVDVGWFAALPSIALAVVGVVLGRISRIPAGPLLVTAALGAAVKLGSLFPVVLPQPLLVIAYGLVGWFVGLQFDRRVLGAALRNLPAMILATLALVTFCGLTGVILAGLMHVDLLTGYLATSPGAIDTMAILALNGQANMSVVMAIQTLRFFGIILTAPYLVSFICWLAARKPD